MLNPLSKYDDIIQGASHKYGVDPELIKAVIRQESSGDPKAFNDENDANAAGLMQLTPANQKAYNITDPFDPAQNIYGGTRLLSENLKAANGDVKKALIYYRGGFKPEKWGAATLAYPSQIEAKYNQPVEGTEHVGSSFPLPSQKRYPMPFVSEAEAADNENRGGDGNAYDDIEAAANKRLQALNSGSSSSNNTPVTPIENNAEEQAVSSPYEDIESAANKRLQSLNQSSIPPPPSPSSVQNGSPTEELWNNFSDKVGTGVSQAGVDMLGAGIKGANFLENQLGYSSPTLQNAQNAAMLAGAANEKEYGKSYLYQGTRLGLEALPFMTGAEAAGAGVKAIPYVGDALSGVGNFLDNPITYNSVSPLVKAGQKAAQLGGQAVKNGFLGALQGAGANLATSGSSNLSAQDLAKQGAEWGGALGAGFPLASETLEGIANYLGNKIPPITKKGISNFAQKIIQKASGGDLTDDLGNYNPQIPGSYPTMAQIYPQLAKLQETVREGQTVGNDKFLERELQQSAARNDLFETIAGNAQDLQKSKNIEDSTLSNISNKIASSSTPPSSDIISDLSKPAILPLVKQAEKEVVNSGQSNPFQAARDKMDAIHRSALDSITRSPEDLDQAIETRDRLSSPLYEAANNQKFQADSKLNELMKTPSMQAALKRAEKLASERQEPLKQGVDLPLQSSSTPQSPILDAHGNPHTSSEGVPPSQQSTYSGKSLNYIKMGLDDIINSGNALEGMGAHEKAAIINTKNQLLDWMDSKSDIYKNARKTYGENSGPIESMQYLQNLNLTDSNGNVSPAKLDTAIKKIEVLQSQKGLNSAKSIPDDTLQQLKDLQTSLNNAKATPIPATLGADAIAQVQSTLAKKLHPSEISSLPAPDRAAMENLQEKINNNYNTNEEFRNYELASHARNAQETLQKMNIRDNYGNITLPKLNKAINNLSSGSDYPLNAQQTAGLSAIQNDLQSLQNVKDQLKANGSPTTPKAIRQKNLDDQLPGNSLIGKLLKGTTVGSLIGTGIGHLIDQPIEGGALGASLGGSAGAWLQTLASARKEAIINEIRERLLNPQAFRNVTPSSPSTARQVVRHNLGAIGGIEGSRLIGQ